MMALLWVGAVACALLFAKVGNAAENERKMAPWTSHRAGAVAMIVWGALAVALMASGLVYWIERVAAVLGAGRIGG